MLSLLSILFAGVAAAMPGAQSQSVADIERAARLCGTYVTVQKLPPEMGQVARTADIKFYPQIEVSPTATRKQRRCLGRRVPAFRLLDDWNANHPRR